MSRRQQELVRNIVAKALRQRFGDNADRFEDDACLYGVSFANGGFIEVAITDATPDRAVDNDGTRDG